MLASLLPVIYLLPRASSRSRLRPWLVAYTKSNAHMDFARVIVYSLVSPFCSKLQQNFHLPLWIWKCSCRDIGTAVAVSTKYKKKRTGESNHMKHWKSAVSVCRWFAAIVCQLCGRVVWPQLVVMCRRGPRHAAWLLLYYATYYCHYALHI